MTNRSVVLLLFLVKAALATPSLDVVTGAGWVDGVYEEKREPELHFKKIGEADFEGNYWFLYTDSRRPQTWIIGRGKTLSTAEARFRAPARAGRPAVTQWSYVGDGSREGLEEGYPYPYIRVVGVETNLTRAEVEKKLRTEEPNRKDQNFPNHFRKDILPTKWNDHLTIYYFEKMGLIFF